MAFDSSKGGSHIFRWKQLDDHVITASQREEKLLFIRFTSNWCREQLVFDKELATDLTLRQFLLERMIPVTIDVTKCPHYFKLYSVGRFPDDIIRNVEGNFVLSRQLLENPPLKDFVHFAQQLYQEGRKYKHSLGNPDARCYYQGVDDDSLIQLPSSLDKSKEQIVELFLRHFDGVHGGFGTSPKYPNATILETLFYLYHRSADEVLLYQVILKTLSNMFMGLVDTQDHGFVRCAYRPDWGSPSSEKLLISQVEGIKTFATAFQITGNHAYFTAAKKTLDFVFNQLYSPSSGCFQAAVTCVNPHSTIPTLKVLEEQERVRRVPCDAIVDPLEVTSWNLQLIQCVLALHVHLNNKEYVDRALHLLNKYKKVHERRGFLPHVLDEDNGQYLLEDQVAFLEACHSAYEISLDEEYIQPIFSMIELLVKQGLDDSKNAFKPLFDMNASNKALVHEEWHDVEWNARLANVLYHVDDIHKILMPKSERTFDHATLANQIVFSLRNKHRCFSPSLGHYFFAIQHALRESIKIYLLGDKNSPKLQQFHQLILKKYEPLRILIHVPPHVLDEHAEVLPKTRDIDKEPVMIYFKYQDVWSPPITSLRQLEIGLERIGMI